MESNTIKLTVGGKSFTATLAENSSAAALKERLAQGSVSIRMNDYGDMEKVGSLGFSLPRNDERITTRPGDLIPIRGTLRDLLRYQLVEPDPIGTGGRSLDPQPDARTAGGEPGGECRSDLVDGVKVKSGRSTGVDVAFVKEMSCKKYFEKR